MRTPPSSWAIFWTDTASSPIISGAALLLFIGLMVKLTGTLPGSRGKPDIPVDPEVASMVLAGALTAILFLAAIMALRVARIRALFEQGREVEASVRKVTHFRGGRQKLDLELKVHGVPHQLSCSFLRSSRTPAFSEGTQISVLLDPGNPTRAVPLALYERYEQQPGRRARA
jgi:hypothetical protein